MKILMRTLAAGPDGVFPAGKVCDVPEPLASQFQESWAGDSAAAPVVQKPADKKPQLPPAPARK